MLFCYRHNKRLLPDKIYIWFLPSWNHLLPETQNLLQTQQLLYVVFSCFVIFVVNIYLSYLGRYYAFSHIGFPTDKATFIVIVLEHWIHSSPLWLFHELAAKSFSNMQLTDTSFNYNFICMCCSHSYFLVSFLLSIITNYYGFGNV